MKLITLVDETTKERYIVNIVFCVFDIRNSMLSSDFEVASANNSTDALKYYNKAKGLTDKYKRADAYEGGASICVYKNYYDKHGTRYRIGKKVWYKII